MRRSRPSASRALDIDDTFILCEEGAGAVTWTASPSRAGRCSCDGCPSSRSWRLHQSESWSMVRRSPMKIVDVIVETFAYKSQIVRDSEGHTHPGPEHDATQTLLRIVTDKGVEGYSFGANRGHIERIVKPILVGQDPFYRERIWQQLKERQRLQPGAHFTTACCRSWTWRCGTWPGARWASRSTSCWAASGTRSRPMPAPCAATTCRADWTRRRPTPSFALHARRTATPRSSCTPGSRPSPARPISSATLPRARPCAKRSARTWS